MGRRNVRSKLKTETWTRMLTVSSRREPEVSMRNFEVTHKHLPLKNSLHLTQIVFPITGNKSPLGSAQVNALP